MKQNTNKNFDNLKWKKRKANEYYVFDIYINIIIRIVISKKEEIPKINIEELNSIIIKFPPYMMKKKKQINTKYSIESNVINYNYNSCKSKEESDIERECKEDKKIYISNKNKEEKNKNENLDNQQSKDLKKR